MSVMEAKSSTPLFCRVPTATRTCWRDTPASSSLLTILRTRMSLKEYRRWEPEPRAALMEGCSRPVRAQ